MKILYIVLGTLSLILGIIGIFIPLLPTTPFLLLTAALYVRSSNSMYQWLINQKYLGNYIRNYRENKAVPLRGKIVCMVFLWSSILYSIFFLVPLIWVKIVLLVIAIGVTIHVLSLKTLKKKNNSKTLSQPDLTKEST